MGEGVGGGKGAHFFTSKSDLKLGLFPRLFKSSRSSRERDFGTKKDEGKNSNSTEGFFLNVYMWRLICIPSEQIKLESKDDPGGRTDARRL